LPNYRHGSGCPRLELSAEGIRVSVACAARDKTVIGGMVRNPYLEIADRHIADTERLIAEQRGYVQRLVERGRDASRAQEILVTLENGLASFSAHRDRVLGLLDTLDPPPPADVKTTN
jgi:hypothetical protein